MDFYESWWYLHNHPMNNEGENMDGISHGLASLDIFVTKVNPDTNQIDDDRTKNTKVQIWLEFGPVVKNSVSFFEVASEDESYWQSSHDPELDCGANTFEEAIIELAKKVKNKYGWIK